jgi:hypothetical protein
VAKMTKLTKYPGPPAASAAARYPGSRNGQTAAKPAWDANRRELRLGVVVIKWFRTPACCQEQILAAFEEEGWPERIDDPLGHVPGKNSKRRLHNAINCLNRSHQVPALTFHGDGTGMGIIWKRADA